MNMRMKNLMLASTLLSGVLTFEGESSRGPNDSAQRQNGVLKFANGDTYRGELEEGKANGQGVCEFADGS
ncbi:hypothetical protein AGMMS49949_02650 [Alphaproteobacteria bacterium]|nr:hypothetical protein AGMMS49949_02650 [Alphaproteobacteria bacterium]GHS96009.1 hypothetical protein AGMMS50296_1660 [Alphaproteobacteria bacterium]